MIFQGHRQSGTLHKSYYLQSTDTKWCMAYLVASFSMTLSEFQGHAPIADLLKSDFQYNCAVIVKISTDIVRRMVPLR